MIIFLYGSDSYQSRQKLQEIIEHYQKIHKSGLNLKYFNEEDLNFPDFKNEIQSLSMFKEKKLIVLKGVFADKNFQEAFLKERRKISKSENIVVIYEKEEIKNKNSTFFKFLKKYCQSQEFESLTGQKLKKWVKKEFEKLEAKVEPKGIEQLINFAGSDSWRLSNEIQKLASYKKGKIIQIKDVELLVRPKIETDIFKTIDAVASGQKRKALSLIKKHIEKGDSPLYLLSMLNYQFRNLILVKSSRAPKLHPYVLRKSIEQTRRFSFEELKKIYRKMLQADFNIKTGRMEPQVALDLLITEI